MKAFSSVAGRLRWESKGAYGLADELRSELARTDLDAHARGLIWGALALIGGKLAPNPPGNLRRVTDLLVSVAFPLRDQSKSPAWPILEQLARRSFNKDTPAMMEWVMKTYRIEPDAARPLPAR